MSNFYTVLLYADAVLVPMAWCMAKALVDAWRGRDTRSARAFYWIGSAMGRGRVSEGTMRCRLASIRSAWRRERATCASVDCADHGYSPEWHQARGSRA